MNKKILIISVAAICFSGCYRVTVNTGAPPSPQTVDKPWQLSFVIGLVPPPELNTKEACPKGVATVMTERSFLNSLVGGLTGNLLTPMHVSVTCAAGPVANMGSSSEFTRKTAETIPR